MTTKPAILGGKPVFAEKQHIVKPLLPDVKEMLAETEGILTSGMVTKGKHLVAFEEGLCETLQVKNAVAVSSCTSGLMLSYQALGLTGEVVVPSFTFMATVSALVWAGLTPVYADVKYETTNLDPEKAEAAITDKTSAIVAVHNFGNPAEIKALQAVADKHGVKLLFDAAHGMGSLYDGKSVASQGQIQSYSLSPTKVVIAGEGGIVTTNDDALAETIRVGREYGNSGNYDSAFAGVNARMGEFNALMGLKSLQMLDGAVARRNEVAAIYREKLASVPGIDFQQIRSEDRSSYKDFSVTIDKDAFGIDRDTLAKALLAENVDTRPYYDPAVHQQTAYKHFTQEESLLPNTIRLAQDSLSFPIYSHMKDEMVSGVCEAIEKVQLSATNIAKS